MAPKPPTPTPRVTPSMRVAALTALIACGAVALYAFGVHGAPPLEASIRLPWWSLAILFYLAERHSVTLSIRRESHTFSLNEVAIVLGLFFAAPAHLLIGQAVGSLIAMGVHRRLPPLKLAFNGTLFAFGGVLSIVVFRLFAERGEPFAVAGWVGAFAATALVDLCAVALVVAVVSIASGAFDGDGLGLEVGFGLATTFANTSLALFVVTILHFQPSAAWLALVPAATVVIAYRAFTRERHRRTAIEGLHGALGALGGSPEVEAGVAAVLRQARELFGAEVAEIALLPAGGDAGVRRSTLGPGDASSLLRPSSFSEAEEHALGAGTGNERTLLLPRAIRRSRFCVEHDLRDAMLTTLGGAERVGVLMVGDRASDRVSFNSDDVVIFETFASQVLVSLQNARLEKALSRERKLKDQLRHEAFHDSLTGLPNRALFLDRVEHALARRGGDREHAVLFLDIDDFKTVNDSLGHGAGDDVLVAVARRLLGCADRADTVARLGGDEFAVLLEDIADLRSVAENAERILTALSEPINVAGDLITIGASVGIRISDETSGTGSELLRDADVAMYTAKDDGKGACAVFEPRMRDAVVARHQLKADLQRAVLSDEFVVYYQPIVDLVTSRMVAVEALVRWNHPQRGLLAPGEFIPVAETTSLMVPIGRRVLEQACGQVRAWQLAYPEHAGLQVTVNLSARELQEDDLVAGIDAVRRACGLAPELLVLELTESAAMRDMATTLSRLAQLHDLGISLAIDDFGTGFSSLSHLQRFPVDVLKIAKPFIDGVADGSRDSAFVTTLIGLGEVLGLKVVAEGIEGADQAAELVRLGCGIGQGYLFARPMPARELEALLSADALPIAA